MDFDELISFALLMIPGALAQSFYQRLRPKSELGSEFQRVFHSFLYGWPVLMANWLVVNKWFSLDDDFNRVVTLFGSLEFFIVYFVCSLVFAFLMACVLVLLRGPGDWFFSKVAVVLKQPIVNSQPLWEVMFYHNNTQAVEIRMPDGVVLQGFLESSSSTPEDGDLLVANSDIFDQQKECFQEVKRAYVNARTGIVVREFSMDAYLAKLNRKEDRNE